MTGAGRAALAVVVATGAVAAAGLALPAFLGTGRAWMPDAVVVALLLGLFVRALWSGMEGGAPLLDRLTRVPLEAAIVLLGMATNLAAFLPLGAGLAVAVVVVVGLALGAGVAIGRRTGLTRTHTLLVASGNAICGNSAIAAVARVVGAPATEAASAVALTAVLSVVVVLLLPLGGVVLGLSEVQYGVWAGLTVYAVPQVLAATFPVSQVSGEIGTLVKMARVLLLAPWLMLLARQASGGDQEVVRWRAILPPYLVAFLAGAALHTAGLIPGSAAALARTASHGLTVVAMAAVGLSVRWESLRAVGARTAVATLASLVVLMGAALLAALAAAG